jgi:ribosomal protein S18 acetylase RimI-like enzyme
MNTRFREHVTPEDEARVRDIVVSTGFFSPAEVEIAVELVQERLAKGVRSGYEFLFAEQEGRVAGYACYGEIAGTAGSYDLYWIAVHQRCRGLGLGRVLLFEIEQRIALAGGRRIYAETSGRAQYLPTRSFYEACGFIAEATLADFYAPGDDKVVYSKSATLAA